MNGLLAAVALIALSSLVSAQIPVPVIQSIASGGEDSLSVIWDVQDPQNKTLFTKFRVAVSTDDWLTSFEWPAQLKQVPYDSTDEPYRSLETKSNFECLNECMRDGECKFVIRSSNQSGVNCYLKKEITELRRAADPDSEYAFVNVYSQVVFLRHLSSGKKYSFKVAVFDSVSASWSEFSQSMSFEENPIFEMAFKRTGEEVGKLSWWNEYGHIFSRYGLLVSVNDSSFTEIIHLNPNSLATFEHPSGYFSIEDYSKFTMAYDQQVCVNACFDDPQCVQLVYFTEDFKSAQGTILAPKNSCFLNHKLDIVNAIYKKTNVVVLGVKETGVEYEFVKASKGVWKFHLESLNPYGVYHNDTALITYNLTDGTPFLRTATISSTVKIIWDLPEPLALKRSAIYYTVNGSAERIYHISQSTDFEDPHEKVSEVSSFNECFEACYQSQSCLAYTFNQEAKQCILKTKIDTPSPCQSGTICGTIPPVSYELSVDVFYNTQYCFYAYATTKFDYTTPVGKLICLTAKNEVSIVQVDKFLPGRTARLQCMAVQLNGKIDWFKNLKPIDLNALNAQLSGDRAVLTVYNVTNRVHNGVYHCENILNNSQVLTSMNLLDVQVTETVPIKPVNAHIKLTGTHENPSIQLHWETDAFTLPVNCINLYHSQEGVAFETKTYCSSTLRGGVLILNQTFNCQDTFMFQAVNSVGNSEMSDLFHFDPDECQDSPQKKSPATYFGAFLSFLVISVLLTIALLGLIINKRANNGSFRFR